MHSLLLALALAFAPPTKPPPQFQARKPATKAEILTADLFLAITNKNPAAVRSVLARKADPNGRNWLGFTALMWAANRGEPSIVDMLLAKGAQVNAKSMYGTALSFAINGRHEAVALHLLDKGASIECTRYDQATPLMLASADGSVKLVKRLLQKKADPNAKDLNGDTALIYAARMGKTEVAAALLKASAKVDTADEQGRTALMYAAMNGCSQVVDLLLAHRASVHTKDKGGATPLLLACRYSGSPAVIGSLLSHGASTSVTDSHGATPLSLATQRGYTEAADLLRKAGGAAAAPASAAPPVTVNQAVTASLATIQSGMKAFAERVQCVSCHHQGFGMMTLGAAAQRGFAVDKALIGSYFQRMGEDGKEGGPYIHQALQDKTVINVVRGVEIGDFAIGSGYILGALVANNVPPNPGFAEGALLLANLQPPNGSWTYGMDREPLQSSYFTTTALVLQVLRAYGPKEAEPQLAACYDRAKRWLAATPAPNTEDKAARLFGLKWAGATAEERQSALRELLAAQRPDGGWSQTAAMPSDAHATGIALYALHVGGDLPTDDNAYQRGVQFLLRTQDEDGSWYVNKRTMPANNYFDAGFPHGESQYTSFDATCWATLALLQCSEPPKAARR
jgi:ankyrin repeat protein